MSVHLSPVRWFVTTCFVNFGESNAVKEVKKRADHVAIMVDDRVPEEEVGHGRRDLGPAVVLDDEVRYPRCGGEFRRPLLWDAEVDVRDPRRTDLEALAEELALGIDCRGG